MDDGLVRETYERLIAIRNAQLRYMATKRKSEGSQFAFLLSPDLVLQFNYVHRIMESFRSGTNEASSADVCARDGGIMGSNLGVLGTGGPSTNAASDGRPSAEDYLASRIVGLLNRPVPVGDRDLTPNARDELAANVRALASLYEERYAMCRDRCERLNEELCAARRQLEAGEAAATAVAATRAGLQPVKCMREWVAGYEEQLRAVRRRLDAFADTARHGRDEAEALARRVDGGLKDKENYGEALQRVLRGLFDRLDGERERILEALDAARRHTSPGPRPADDEVEKRVRDELAPRLQEFEARVEQEVKSRVATVEYALRDEMREQLEKERAELDRRFHSEVDSEVARKLDAYPVLDVSDMADMRRMNDADLIAIKTTLDDLLRMKESAFNADPALPRYETMSPRVHTADRIYRHLRYMLTKIRDLYKFLVVQSEYIESIGQTATREYVPIECMTRQRTMAFVNRIAQILREHEVKERVVENEVLAMLNYILDELPHVKCDVRNRSSTSAK